MHNDIATAQVTENISIAIELFPTGFFGVVSIHHNDNDGREWQGRTYLTSAEARTAANRLWRYIRNAETAKVAA